MLNKIFHQILKTFSEKRFSLSSKFGFTLIELSLSVLLVSAVATYAVTKFTTGNEIEQNKKVAYKLKTIKNSLISLVESRGYFLCPSDPQKSANHPDFGKEERGSDGFCDTSTGLDSKDIDNVTSGYVSDGSGGHRFPVAVEEDIVIGAIPCKSLGLSADCGFDNNGNRLFYAVANILTVPGQCVKFVNDNPASSNDLSIQPHTFKILKDYNPVSSKSVNFANSNNWYYNSPDNDPYAIIGYYGDDGIGAYPNDGGNNKITPIETSSGTFVGDSIYNEINHDLNGSFDEYFFSPLRPLETPDGAAGGTRINKITFGDSLVWINSSDLNNFDVKICAHCRSCESDYANTFVSLDSFNSCTDDTIDESTSDCYCTANSDCNEGLGECCVLGRCSVSACPTFCTPSDASGNTSGCNDSNANTTDCCFGNSCSWHNTSNNPGDSYIDEVSGDDTDCQGFCSTASDCTGLVGYECCNGNGWCVPCPECTAADANGNPTGSDCDDLNITTTDCCFGESCGNFTTSTNPGNSYIDEVSGDNTDCQGFCLANSDCSGLTGYECCDGNGWCTPCNNCTAIDSDGNTNGTDCDDADASTIDCCYGGSCSNVDSTTVAGNSDYYIVGESDADCTGVCNSNSDCPVGYGCCDLATNLCEICTGGTCLDNTDCASTEKCCDGTCIPNADTCADCSVNGICPGTDSCCSGSCQIAACGCTPGTETTDCPVGEDCCNSLCQLEATECTSCTQGNEATYCPDGEECCGGTCQPDADTCSSCTTDTDCPNGEECCDGTCQPEANACTDCSVNGICSGTDNCCGGTCQVATCACTPATQDTDCASGDECCNSVCQLEAAECTSCTQGNEATYCPDGEECCGGTCQPDADTCSSCTTDTDCPNGEECCDGTCQPEANACTDCSVNGICSGTDNCCGGTCQVGACTCTPATQDTACETGEECCNSLCQTNSAECTSCTQGNEATYCPDGEECCGGTCQPDADICAGCTSSSECPSGERCCGGTCQVGACACEPATESTDCPTDEYCCNEECLDNTETCTNCTQGQELDYCPNNHGCCLGDCQSFETQCIGCSENSDCPSANKCCDGQCISNSKSCDDCSVLGICPDNSKCCNDSCIPSGDTCTGCTTGNQSNYCPASESTCCNGDCTDICNDECTPATESTDCAANEFCCDGICVDSGGDCLSCTQANQEDYCPNGHECCQDDCQPDSQECNGCTNNSECPQGETCCGNYCTSSSCTTCSVNSDCGSGEKCCDGVCKPESICPDGTCTPQTEDADCESDEFCCDNECIINENNGDECDGCSQSDQERFCPQNYECCGSLCKPDGTQCINCNQDIECPLGQTCCRSTNSCVTSTNDCPASCTNDSECNSGEDCCEGLCQKIGTCTDCEVEDGQGCEQGPGVACCAGDCKYAQAGDSLSCDPDSCTQIGEEFECNSGEECCDGSCQPDASECTGCTSDATCPNGQVCCGNVCKSTCSSCTQANQSSVCQNDEKCCNGSCQDDSLACTGCTENRDCPAFEACCDGTCQTAGNTCTGCTQNNQNSYCPDNQECCDGTCQDTAQICTGCSADTECPQGEECCDGTCQTAGNTCTGCTQADESADCPGSQECCNGTCQASANACTGCSADTDCPNGETCCDGTCQPAADPCGCTQATQGSDCSSGEECCNGDCQASANTCTGCSADIDCPVGENCCGGTCGTSSCFDCVDMGYDGTNPGGTQESDCYYDCTLREGTTSGENWDDNSSTADGGDTTIPYNGNPATDCRYQCSGRSTTIPSLNNATANFKPALVSNLASCNYDCKDISTSGYIFGSLGSIDSGGENLTGSSSPGSVCCQKWPAEVECHSSGCNNGSALLRYSGPNPVASESEAESFVNVSSGNPIPGYSDTNNNAEPTVTLQYWFHGFTEHGCFSSNSNTDGLGGTRRATMKPYTVYRYDDICNAITLPQNQGASSSWGFIPNRSDALTPEFGKAVDIEWYYNPSFTGGVHKMNFMHSVNGGSSYYSPSDNDEVTNGDSYRGRGRGQQFSCPSD